MRGPGARAVGLLSDEHQRSRRGEPEAERRTAAWMEEEEEQEQEQEQEEKVALP